MSINFGFKDKYYDFNNNLIAESSLKFVSDKGSFGGDLTRFNPLLMGNNYKTFENNHVILSPGVYFLNNLTNSWLATYHGSGMGQSYVYGNNFNDTKFIDCTINSLSGVTNVARCHVINPQSNCNYWSSLIQDADSSFAGTAYSSSLINCDWSKGLENTIYYGNLIFSNCKFFFGKGYSLDGWKYINPKVFHNCKFKLGSESDYSELSGSTPEEMKIDFINRCNAGGVVNHNNVASWVFCKEGVEAGVIIKGSELDRICDKPMGYKGGWRYTSVKITDQHNVPVSFNPDNSSASLKVSTNSIAFNQGIDISTKQEGYVSSNIIWLGGIQKLTDISIMHSLPVDSGVDLNSGNNVLTPAVASNAIVEGKYYIVRSTNMDLATITYAGGEYNSSVSIRKNIFKGGTVTTFSGSPNAQVFEIDPYPANTIKMRIVSEIPTNGKITSGNLDSGYWYIVEPENATEPKGYVSYNGVNYPPYASFLSKGGGFSSSENCKLRRCWREDYRESDETIDVGFWSGKQKPIWFDVCPTDLRCMMKNNSQSELEMKKDAKGIYIASGHRDFYSNIIGANGIKLPAYSISGAFLQLKLVVNTLNVM